MSAQLERIKAEMLDFVIDVTKSIAFHIDTTLYVDTPVDTTNAQNNWRASVGSAVSGVVGSKRSPSITGFLAGLRDIAAFRYSHGMLWISNNVHYITDLDAGYSPQAPPRFIERAIRKALRAAQNGINPKPFGGGKRRSSGRGRIKQRPRASDVVG